MKRFFAIFFFILIFGFIFFYLFKSIIGDTGFYFAYDYLINKLELDNTKNKISLKNYKNTIINEKDTEYEFENILGFKNMYSSNQHQTTTVKRLRMLKIRQLIITFLYLV